MLIAGLNFKAYAAKKPIAISPTGDLLTAKQMLSSERLTASLGEGSMFVLGKGQQIQLTVERYKLEPEFKLGLINGGVFTKREAINQIQEGTEIGQLMVRAEMGYLNNLRNALYARKKIPKKPTIPKPTVPDAPYWRTTKRCVDLRIPMRAVFCEDTTDPVTTPFANYRIKHVHPVFKKRGFVVIVLKGTDDVRANFVTEAKKRHTVYLGGIGHGNYDLYTGHWGNQILKVGVYDASEVEGKAIHFLSCRTAAQLGPDTVTNGALSYAGYTENFILQWDDSATPVDEFKLFADSDSTFDLMMANGRTAQQAYDATIQAFDAAINQVPNQVAASYLTWDRDHLSLLGTASTKIKPFKYVRICFPFRVLEKQDALVAAGELRD